MATIGAGILAGVLPNSRGKRDAVNHTKTVKCIYRKTFKSENGRLRLKEYFEQASAMIRSYGDDGGPPRWFTPLECGCSQSNNSPLLLYLPGIEGTGLGLVINHKKLGEIFDVWCLHIPIMDRTKFTELLDLVEKTVRSENQWSQNRPIYLVGESLGACIALSVAARNPDLDLILVLANPATSFRKSQLSPMLPLLQIMPEQLNFIMHSILCFITGIPLKSVITILEKGLSTYQSVEELIESRRALTSYLFVMADLLPRETLIWKLKLLSSASAYANSRIHAVKAQTLIISSERDLLLPNREEGERLCQIIPKSEIRILKNSGHALFLEDDVDLVTILKGASFYRQGRYIDYASDYIPPTPSEIRKIYKSIREMEAATSPVMLSTLEDGNIVRGLAGVPSKGPVLYVGNHMLLGCELDSFLTRFLIERDISIRGLGHQMLFTNSKNSGQLDKSAFDHWRLMGAVPVSPANIYRLLASNSHVLLYPGGTREARHRIGEEHMLCWPEQPEFVRMAANFGAKIVPFGVVGEDDFVQVIHYIDLLKIGYFKDDIGKMTTQASKVSGLSVEAGGNEVHVPIMLPKVPGRFYYFFGKPIETEGRKHEIRSRREKASELYAQVKSEVEKCILFLKQKREHDPYRTISSRLIFQAKNGFDSQIPTFEL